MKIVIRKCRQTGTSQSAAALGADCPGRGFKLSVCTNLGNRWPHNLLLLAALLPAQLAPKNAAQLAAQQRYDEHVTTVRLTNRHRSSTRHYVKYKYICRNMSSAVKKCPHASVEQIVHALCNTNRHQCAHHFVHVNMQRTQKSIYPHERHIKN